VQLSNKILGLDSLFSEVVDNHRCRSKESLIVTTPYFLVTMIKLGL